MKGEGKERYQRLTEPRIAAGEEVKSKRKKKRKEEPKGYFCTPAFACSRRAQVVPAQQLEKGKPKELDVDNRDFLRKKYTSVVRLQWAIQHRRANRADTVAVGQESLN